MKNKNLIYTVGMAYMLLDQIIKLIVIKNMSLFQEIQIIPKFFSLYYLKNTGAAFSILGDKTLFLIIFSIVCLIILKNYTKTLKRVTTLTIISLGIMMGGIVGNLFDRVIYKGVIDYLSFNFFGYSFPVFNIADIGITIGAILLTIDLLQEGISLKNKDKRFNNKIVEKKHKIWYNIGTFDEGGFTMNKETKDYTIKNIESKETVNKELNRKIRYNAIFAIAGLLLAGVAFGIGEEIFSSTSFQYLAAFGGVGICSANINALRENIKQKSENNTNNKTK